MVNGMGGTPLMELYVVFAEVATVIRGKGARVARTLVGNYVTSLDMPGFSVTICRLDDDLTAPLGRAGGDAGAALGPLMGTCRWTPPTCDRSAVTSSPGWRQVGRRRSRGAHASG